MLSRRKVFSLFATAPIVGATAVAAVVVQQDCEHEWLWFSKEQPMAGSTIICPKVVCRHCGTTGNGSNG